MLNSIGKILTLVCLPFLAYGFAATAWKIAVAVSFFGARFFAFVVGATSFSFFWLIFRRYLQVVCTFEHELTHLLVGLLFFKRPRSLVVTFNAGGYVEMTGGNNFLVTLAPYFLPTVSYLLLPILLFAPEKHAAVLNGILGASVAFHLFSTRSEIHFGQSDLHRAGLFFSAAFLPVANLISYGALLAVVSGEKDNFVEFWTRGAAQSLNLLFSLFK